MTIPAPFETAAAAADESSPDTARRIRTEGTIAARTVSALLAAGYTISVHDGEETVVSRCSDHATIVGALFSTDSDTLLAHWHGQSRYFGSVQLIYGNDGHDLIADYSVALEPVMREISALADRLSRGRGF